MMALFDITSLNNWLTLRAIALYIISTIALYHVIRKIREFYLLYQAIERLPGPKITYDVFLGNLYALLNVSNHVDILTRKSLIKYDYSKPSNSCIVVEAE